MNRRRFGTGLAAIVACVTLPVLAGPAAEQSDTVRIEGKVAWIAGQKVAAPSIPGVAS